MDQVQRRQLEDAEFLKKYDVLKPCCLKSHAETKDGPAMFAVAYRIGENQFEIHRRELSLEGDRYTTMSGTKTAEQIVSEWWVD